MSKWGFARSAVTAASVMLIISGVAGQYSLSDAGGMSGISTGATTGLGATSSFGMSGTGLTIGTSSTSFPTSAAIAPATAGVGIAPATAGVGGSADPNKGSPLFIKPGTTYKMQWLTSPPHPDVVMCCGGGLQLSWNQMDSSGVDRSVVLNVDSSCPNGLLNQQYVKYLVQAATTGNLLLNYAENGDYYISDPLGSHCSNGMAFLLAVRNCPKDNPTYTPVTPISRDAIAACNGSPPPAGLNTTAASPALTVEQNATANALSQLGLGALVQGASKSSASSITRVLGSMSALLLAAWAAL